MKLNIGQKLNLGFSSILALFILVGIVIYIFNIRITQNATNIREDDVPGVVLVLSLLDKISDMNANIGDYLLGEADSKEEFASNYQEFLGSFEELKQLETTSAEVEVMQEIEQLLSTYVNAANSEIFDKFDPTLEQWAIQESGEIEHGLGVEFEEFLEEAKESKLQDIGEIKDGEEILTDNVSVIRYYTELIDEAGDLLAHISIYANGEVDDKEEFTENVEKFETSFNELKQLEQKPEEIVTLDRIYTTYIQIKDVAEEIFSTYDPQTKVDAIANANRIKREIFEDKLEKILNDLAAKESQEAQAATLDLISVLNRNSFIMVTAIAITLVVGLVIAFFLARSIANAAKQMAYVAKGISQGELDRPIIVTSKDEMGDLAIAFQRMVTYVREMAEVASRLTEGDVGVNITPQSDKDVLGHAFRRMIGYQQQMAGVADRLAQGDLTANVIPQSEQDVLGNAFSLMTTNLRSLIGQVIETVTTVNTASGQLATAAEQAGQASQQVASTIQQIAQGTTQQTQAVTEATGNVEQLARAADGIARGAQAQAVGVQKASTTTGEMTAIVEQVGQVALSVNEANSRMTEAARHGVNAVEQTSQGMAVIRERTLAAADKVKEMGNRSREIGRIVETIDDIADKTDMLALNAAVEAARAGEHGRGFAVVADQVRKLSEDSKVATRDIGELIERVQETVREAITAMESTVAEVGNGTRLAGDTARSLSDILQAAEGAASLARRITEAVGQLRQKSEGVATAIEAVSAVVEENTAVSEEMAASSREVMGAMEGIAGVAEENSASAEEVSASAEEMSAQIEEVVASTQELSLLADQLRAVVAQFRVEENSSLQPERVNRSWGPVSVPAGRQRPQVKPALVSRHNNGN